MAEEPRFNMQDFAILLGVSRYSHYAELGDLSGPEQDCDAFAGWLTDPAGGALPPENLIVLRSPTRQEAEGSFERMFYRFVSGPGRRCYLFGAGHGFANETGDAALFMADASPERQGNAIDLRAYADAMFHGGLFSEVVLFADFARTTMMSAAAAKPFWRTAEPARRADARFYAFRGHAR